MDKQNLLSNLKSQRAELDYKIYKLSEELQEEHLLELQEKFKLEFSKEKYFKFTDEYGDRFFKVIDIDKDQVYYTYMYYDTLHQNIYVSVDRSMPITHFVSKKNLIEVTKEDYFEKVKEYIIKGEKHYLERLKTKMGIGVE